MTRIMTDYNRRQLRLILEKLDAFDKNELALGKLVSDLDALIDTTEDIGNEWTSEIRKQWGILEDIYAYLLDQGLPSIPNEHLALSRKAGGEIRRLVEKKL